MRRSAPQLGAGLFSIVMMASSLSIAQPISIQLARDTPAEQQAKVPLERLLKRYDTAKYTFTQSVIIQERAIPHSHPVLTLNTRHLGQDDETLSTYLHEPIHWFLDERQQQTRAAEDELTKLYPNPPVGGDDGAQDLESDYLHLIVCELEREADLQPLGPERTESVMRFWANDHYKWIYRTVSADYQKIQTVIRKHNLEIL
jgi:hypothetical protein